MNPIPIKIGCFYQAPSHAVPRTSSPSSPENPMGSALALSQMHILKERFSDVPRTRTHAGQSQGGPQATWAQR